MATVAELPEINSESRENFILNNKDDLNALGLLFLQLLSADFHAVARRPSPVLALVLMLEHDKCLGTKKPFIKLQREMLTHGIPFFTDGFGGSVLRAVDTLP